MNSVVLIVFLCLKLNCIKILLLILTIISVINSISKYGDIGFYKTYYKNYKIRLYDKIILFFPIILIIINMLIPTSRQALYLYVVPKLLIMEEKESINNIIEILPNDIKEYINKK